MPRRSFADSRRWLAVAGGCQYGGMTLLPGPDRLHPATRAAIAPFYVMRVWAAAAERAARGLPVFNLAAGQPSTSAPRTVLDAAHRALDSQILGYTEAPGILPLRAAIAGHYRDRYQLDIDPANVVVTTGSSGGFVLAFLAAFDPGARVGLARPGYPAYRNILQALGCEVVDLPCGPETRFQPTVSMLEGQDLDGLIVASPANPTGTMVTPAELAELARYCAVRGIRLVSDEIYHGITYGGAHGAPASAWATDRGGIVVNSFSKYFSMTGWRIGWLLVPDDLVDSVDAIAGNLAICPPAPSQYAAIAAFDAYDECDGHVQRYAANRRLMIDGLAALGITRLAPADGAFYLYADVSDITDDSQALCWDLLDTVGVAAAPGLDFDPVNGHRYLRFSFAGNAETLQGAVEALGRYLATR
jgi:aspartate/methionine/tyrosine aminotransferase